MKTLYTGTWKISWKFIICKDQISKYLVLQPLYRSQYWSIVQNITQVTSSHRQSASWGTSNFCNAPGSAWTAVANSNSKRCSKAKHLRRAVDAEVPVLLMSHRTTVWWPQVLQLAISHIAIIAISTDILCLFSCYFVPRWSMFLLHLHLLSCWVNLRIRSFNWIYLHLSTYFVIHSGDPSMYCALSVAWKLMDRCTTWSRWSPAAFA